MILLLVSAAFACGPFFSTLEFTTTHSPDPDYAAFASGNLGIVSAEWYDTWQVVAWRALHGAPLQADEQAAAVAAWKPDDSDAALDRAIQTWTVRRKEIAEAPRPWAWMTGEDYEQWVNCNADAFVTAARTLGEREASWGRTGPVLDWLAAQDRVFGACSDAEAPPPEAAPSGSPRLLVQDRAYQHAAWLFYKQRYAEARGEFLAIAADRASPWSGYGTYLAGRAGVRSWSVTGAGPEDVHALLESVKGPLAASARGLLEFGRESPAAPWRDRLAGVLAGPGGIALHPLVDFSIAMDSSRWEAGAGRWGGLTYQEIAPGAAAELVDWIVTLRFPAGPGPADRHALERWTATHDEAWLVAALARSPAPSAELLAAAEAVPRTHAAWPTATWYRAQALAQTNPDAARALYDELLSSGLPMASRNVVERARAPLSTSLHDWLAHVMRTPVSYSDGEEDGAAGAPVPPELLHPTLDADGAAGLSVGAPLAVLEAAAEDPIAGPARDELLRAAWVRAVVLGDDAALVRLSGKVRLEVTGVLAAPDPEARRFQAAVVALRSPGLDYTPRSGTPRRGKLDEIDDFRDNWWSWLPKDVSPLPFLTQGERAALTQELASAGGGGDRVFGAIVLAYAKAHPADPLAPEALALVVRATRFVPEADHATSKAAFQLLHSAYPATDAAKRTRYWF